MSLKTVKGSLIIRSQTNCDGSLLRVDNHLGTLILVLILTLLILPRTSFAADISGPATSSTGSYTITWSACPVASGGYTNIYENDVLIDSIGFSASYCPTTSKQILVTTSGSYVYKADHCSMYNLYPSGSLTICESALNPLPTHMVTVTLTPPPSTPGAISGPSSVSYDSSAFASYTLSWGASSGTVTAYQLEEKIGAGIWTNIYSGTATSNNFSGKESGTYSYRVRACNGNSCSTYTDNKSVVVSASFIATAPLISSSTVAGNSAYSTNVSKHASAVVSVPLAMLPGVNGMQPHLSLAYDSEVDFNNQDNDWPVNVIGHGWKVAGLSAIQRCRKRLLLAPDYDGGFGDRLCLDGQALVQINGDVNGDGLVTNADYWSPGAEYRTEVESFAKITANGVFGNITLEVRTAAGFIRQYGTTVDSKIYVPDLLGTPREHLWAVSERQDRFGNVMSFKYFVDEPNFQIVPLSISYAGAEVEFLYGERPTTYPFQYIYTYTMKRSMYLHSINTRMNGKLVKNTRLIYAAENDEMHLTDVQECGYTEAGVFESCLAPLSFIWSAAPTGDSWVITQVIDAPGVQTLFTYGTGPIITDPSDLPSPQVASRFLDENDSSICTTGQTGCTDATSRSFVRLMQRSNGQGGLNSYYYAVSGPADGYYSATFRGFLGYRAVRMIDVQSGIYTYTFYGNDFPFIGKVIANYAYQGSINTLIPKRLTAIERTFENVDIPSLTPGAKSVFSFQNTETVLQNETIIFFKTTQKDIDYIFDGSALSSTTVTKTVGSTVSFAGSDWVVGGVEKVLTGTTNFETANTTSWLIHFPMQKVVTHSNVPGEVGSKSVSTIFSRYQNTNALGSRTEYSGDPQLERTTTLSYDAVGNVTNIATDAVGVTQQNLSFSSPYLENRYPIQVTNALGHTQTSNIDKRFGKASSVTDFNNLTTNIAYDAFGRETSVALPDGEQIVFSYAECVTCPIVGSHTAKYVQTKTSNAGPEFVTYFDLLGRTIRNDTTSFDNLNYSKVESHYDNLGRLQKRSTPYISGAPAFVSFLYDTRNRVIKETRPDGSYTDITYNWDLVSNLLKITKTDRVITPGLGDVDQTQAMFFNRLGQVTQVWDYLDTSTYVTTDFDYDWYGNLDYTRVDGNTATETTMNFDAAGNRISITEPNTGTTIFNYDGLSRIQSKTDSNGITKTFNYDGLNRLTQRIDDYLGLKQITNTWVYDPAGAKGALKSKSNTDGFSESYIYDGLARLKEVNTSITHDDQNENFTVRQNYDSVGKPLNTTYPSGFIAKNAFNAAGYTSGVRDGSSNQLLHSFTSVSASFQVEQESFANGLSTTRTYNANTGNLDTITTGPSIQNLSYVWRSNGILRSRTDAGKTENFTYDGLNRLKTADVPNTGRTLTTNYENLGNLVSKTSDVAGDVDVTGYVYSAGNAGPHGVSSLSIDGITNALSYDNAGNVITIDATSGLDRTFEYNSFNKPTYIRLGTQASPEMQEWIAYGPDTTRYYRKSIYTESGSNITKRIFYLAGGAYEKIIIDDGANTDVFEKTSVTNIVKHRTVQLQGGLKTSNFIYVHRDHLNSVDVITNQTGNVVDGFGYDPFGKRRLENWSGDITPAELYEIITNTHLRTSRGFTDHEHMDKVGIIHMNGRIYEPTIGRFLSADPIVQVPTYSQSYNRYSYVFNSPLSFTDPSGFSGELPPKLNMEELVVTGYYTGGCSGSCTTFNGSPIAGFGGGSGGSGFGAIGAIGGGNTNDIEEVITTAEPPDNEEFPLAEYYSNLITIDKERLRNAILFQMSFGAWSYTTDYYWGRYKGKGMLYVVVTARQSIIWPSDYHVLISDWGYRNYPTSNDFHRGMDYRNPKGKPVYALSGGRVSFVGQGQNAGDYLKIKGLGKNISFYHTLSVVEEGEIVAPGQVIGYSNGTGAGISGPHTHITTFVNGSKVNPCSAISNLGGC